MGLAGLGFDVAALMLLLVALLLGLTEGMVRLALGVVSVLLGGITALALADTAQHLAQRFIASPEAALLAGTLGVFALTLLVFSIVGWLLRRVIRSLGLSAIDRALGALAATVSVLIAAAAMSHLATIAAPGSALVRQSRLITPLAALGRRAEAELPPRVRTAGSRWMAHAASRLRPPAGEPALAASGEGSARP